MDPVEQMDTAEVLASIVEQACLFVPDASVGSNTKKTEGSIRVKFPNEEPTSVVKVSNEEPTRVVKIPMLTSDLVRSKLFKLACLKL